VHTYSLGDAFDQATDGAGHLRHTTTQVKAFQAIQYGLFTLGYVEGSSTLWAQECPSLSFCAIWHTIRGADARRHSSNQGDEQTGVTDPKKIAERG
jgi:hypothetical protein